MSRSWDDSAEMLARAQTAHAEGDRELSYQLYARASEVNPQDAKAWQGRAETATSTDEALVSYAYAAALDSDNEPLTRTLDAAVAQRVQDAGKADVPFLVALGQEFAEVGLTDRARAVLERASELDTSSTDAFVWLAALASDDQKQLDYLNRALATNPRDPRARAGLLSVKLPTPANALPAPSRDERLASVPTSRANVSTSDTASEVESATMERLRKLRANMPSPEPALGARTPVDDWRKSASRSDTRLRNLLIGLVILVLALALAGFVLMQTP